MAYNQKQIADASLEQLLEFAKNPSKLTAEGTYGEAGAYKAVDLFERLKNAVKEGQLNITDYRNAIDPLTQHFQKSVQNLAGQGRGDIAARVAQEAMSQGFVREPVPGSMRFETQLPFSRNEYAALDAKVLPTQDDVDKGLIGRDEMPFQRLRNPNGGGVDANGDPIPADINLGTDRGAIELEAQRQAGQLQGTLDQQKKTREDALGAMAQELSGIPQKYRDEGTFQEQRMRDMAGEQRDLRSANLNSLATLLAQQQSQRFQDMVPEIAEQANVKGIYRSTGFGDALAREGSKLERDRQTQLGLQGVNDYNAYVDAIGAAGSRGLDFRNMGLEADVNIGQGLAEERYGIADKYAGGMGDVANVRAGLQTGGLQREFGLEDTARSMELAKHLAALNKPAGPSSKSKTAQAVQTGATAAQPLVSLGTMFAGS